jgi:phosphoglycolate phosphatase-like HAD superfamily hydrolase
MIIFDFDGTLVDSMHLCVTELTETFLAMKLPVPSQAELEKCNGPSHEEAAELLKVPRDKQAEFLKIRGGYQMELVDSCQKIYPGVPKMLDTLSACATLCIASNGRQEYVDRSLSNWNIGKYITKAKGGDVSRTKGQLVGELLKEYRPLRAVMAGDRLSDILAGKENGLYTVAAAYGFGSKDEWREADVQAHSVEELTDICLQFCGR